MLEFNGTMIAIVINFLVLVFILNHYLYKPILSMLQDRKSYIEKTLLEADVRLTSANAFMEEGRQTINKAHNFAKEIIDQASVASEKIQNDLTDKAKKEIEDMKTRAKEEILQYKKEAREVLTGEAARLSVAIAEKIIMKKIDDKDTKKMVDNFIESMVN